MLRLTRRERRWRPSRSAARERSVAGAGVLEARDAVLEVLAEDHAWSASEGSLTRAVATIPIAQQSPSAQIRSLERQVGAPLFDRGPRGVELTEVGSALLKEARPLVTQADRAFDRVRRAAVGERQTLNIGFLPSAGNYVVAPLVRAFTTTYPNIALSTEDLPVAALVAGLRTGRLDAGLTRPPLINDLATEVVLTEPVAAVLPAGHPLAAAESLELADLADEPWVLTPRSSWEPWHQKYDRDFAAAGFMPQIVQRGTSVQSLLALVAAGVGVTRLPLSARSLRDTGVAFVPLRGESADVVVARIDDRPRPGVDALRALIQTLADKTDLLAAG
jgi:DNA-binding transcriptional LysR family regulator